jgi:hypothetical protein
VFASEELADFRAVADDALQGVCDLLRNVRTRQPNNSWRDVEQTVAAGIKCRKVPTLQTPEELLQFQTQNTRFVVRMLLSATAPPVYADDVLLYNGKRYPVAGVAERTDQIYMHVLVYDNSRPDVQ